MTLQFRIADAARLSAALGLLAALGLAARLAPALAIVNETPSLPRGLYLRSYSGEPKPGRVVAVRQPPNTRSYLAGLGVPEGAWLLKRVVASGGDVVCAKDAAVSLGSRTVAVLSHDRRGQPLPAWRECRRLAPDELFLLGDTETSFDSRHFGPVSRAAVEGVYRGAVLW